MNMERFKDTARGVIEDTKNRNEWLPKDSYGDLGKWVNLQEGLNYAQLMNQIYAGGQSDWTLPNKEDLLDIYEKDLTQKDWEGNDVHIAPIFLTNCSHYLWSSEKNNNGQHLRIDLRTGDLDFIDVEEREHQAVRLIRRNK
jgi:hypothetical protein